MNSENMKKSNNCIHSIDNSKCCKKSFICYGGYCKKHKDEFLLKDEFINLDNFTGDIKDYKLCDLKKYCNNKISKCPSKFKKDDYFKKTMEYHNKHIYLQNNINSVLKIQSNIRRFNINKNIKLRGLAYLNRKLCNNDEDFYTYESIQDIENKYFFSYKDNQNNYWGFDIRSFDKLIAMNYPNPYTTEPIPQNIVSEVKQKINDLRKDNNYIDISDSIVRERKDAIKQKIVDLFSYIEQSGYTCQIDWFTSLTVRRLKELYRQLEDVWNYRSQLSNQMKRNICPPNADIFNTPMIEVMNYTSKEDLQELILHEVMKFTNAVSDSDRKLGFMYFLIAFGMVSPQCYQAHIDWLSFMMI